jgi:NmrA-like family
MTTSSKKIIAVVSATGNQDSSVARKFLSLSNWHVHCLTRNSSSAAAQALGRLGAELARGDPLILLQSSMPLRQPMPSSLIPISGPPTSTLNTPAKSATTNKTSNELAFHLEVSHSTNIAKAAAGVQTLERFIYSALGPMKKRSRGKYPHSYHWDSKATIVEH